MKKRIELDVDFLGGQGSLTTEEEKALSAYFKQQKAKRLKTVNTSTSKSVAKR